MAPPKRPALSSMVQKKSEPAPAASVEAPNDAAAPKRPADLKTMQVRVNRAGWLEMTHLALERDVPLEELMVEAFSDVLKKHGRPPVAERRQPAR